MSHDPSVPPRTPSDRPVGDSTVRDRTTTTTTTTKSGSSMAIIVAAVILIIAALAYFVFTGADPVETGAPVGTESTAPAMDAPATDPAVGADTTVTPVDPGTDTTVAPVDPAATDVPAETTAPAATD